MKKIFFMFAAALLLFTSCDSQDPKNEQILNQTLSNRVVNLSTNEVTMTLDNAVISLDFVSLKANITILNPDYFESLKDYKKLELRDIPFKPTTAGNILTAASIVPFVDGVADEALTVTSFSGTFFEYETSFTFNMGGYKINATAATALFPYAKTTIKDIAGVAENFVSETTAYAVKMQPGEKTAQITIINPRFAPNMPALGDMTLKGVTLTPTSVGYSLKAESIEPCIGETPYNRYSMTNISGTLVGTTLTLKMTCANKYDMVISAYMHEQKAN